jgi:hypothetical protein
VSERYYSDLEESQFHKIEDITFIRGDFCENGLKTKRTIHSKFDFNRGDILFQMFGAISANRRCSKSVLLHKKKVPIGSDEVWISFDDRFACGLIKQHGKFIAGANETPDIRTLVAWNFEDMKGCLPLVFAIANRDIKEGDELFCNWFMTRRF